MNDLGLQAIFEMVEKIDEKFGERTVGVITKCDASQRVKSIIETAENRDKPLHHGWFVVRNRTPSEVEQGLGPLERFQKEKDFFTEPPWSNLPEERRGTQALKKYLAELLCTRIEQAFPDFLKTIQASRDSAASELQSLGVGRATIEQKRAYLTRIAHDFNSLATQGLRGRYDGLTGNDMKLRMKIRDANDGFVLEMNENGHFLPFVEQTAGESTGEPRTSYTSSFNTPTISAVTTSPFSGGSPSSFSFGSSRNSDASKVRNFCPGTRNAGFEEYQETERTASNPSLVISYQTITFAALYRHFSLEELRLSDYIQAQASSSTPEKTSSVFGRSPGLSSLQPKKETSMSPALDGASKLFKPSNSSNFLSGDCKP